MKTCGLVTCLLQWRSQKLCVRGQTRSPEARGSRRRRRRVGWGLGGVSPRQPTRGSGERYELPNGVRGKAPAANAFSAYSRPYSDTEPIDSILFFSRVRIWKGCLLPTDYREFGRASLVSLVGSGAFASYKCRNVTFCLLLSAENYLFKTMQ